MIIFSAAPIVVFTSLGLVALGLGLLVRRYSTFALAIGLAGLLALTTSLTWITYAGLGVATGNRELERSRELTQELEKLVKAAQSESDRAGRDLAAARTQLAEAQQDVDKAKGEAGRLTETLWSQQAKLAAKVAELEKKLSETIAKVAELEKKLSVAIAHVALRRKLADRLDTPFYTSQPLEQRALVAGLTGSWYVMRLKLDGKPFIFADGQFRMPEAVQKVKESMLQLQNSVLVPVEQVAKRTRLFLRGGADTRRLLGATEVPDVREFRTLPRLPNGTYAAVPRPLPPPVPVRNKDLPNLRADWLRQHIRTVLLTLGSADIEILENPPAPGHERTVDLILYVEW